MNAQTEIIAAEPVEIRLAPAPARQSDQMLAMIERIATSPSFNLEALNAVVALRERIQAGEAKSAFDRDLAAMQPKLPTIDSRGLITVYSKADRDKVGGPQPGDRPQQVTPYALLADINDAIRPALAEHGFALSFRIGQAADGKITVTGILSHRDGHREETTLTLPYDSSGSKNSVQAAGSSYSYGRRYATLMLLNISSRAPQDMDDNGRAAGAGEEAALDDADIAYVEKLLKETNADREAFLGVYKVSAVPALTTAQFKNAIALLEKKRAKALAAGSVK